MKKRGTSQSSAGVSLYYLAGAAGALAFGFPFAPPAGLGLVLVCAAPEEFWAAASCEALRRMVDVVLGGSMGTVGARTERGCLEGHAL